MEIGIWVWAIGVTICAIAADVRISLLTKRLNRCIDDSKDGRDISKAAKDHPERA